MLNSPPASEAVSPRIGAQYHFGDLRFEEVNYTGGFFLPVHAHQAAFLDLCLEGTIQNCWEKNFIRGASTLDFMPAGAPHSSCFTESARTFQIVMNPYWLERIQQVAPLGQTLTHYEEGAAVCIAARLYREFQRLDNVSPLVMEGLLLELLAEMLRHSQTLEENNCPRWLRQANDFLHAHFTESVAIDTIAAAVGVHPAHLMRCFRRHYHCTIGDYVRKLRVDYACHLLSTSDALPAQIAFAVGFADQSHFNRTFKSFLGMTPVEFQKASGQKVSGRATWEPEMLF
jgi:AraC family transcriptional regulator